MSSLKSHNHHGTDLGADGRGTCSANCVHALSRKISTQHLRPPFTGQGPAVVSPCENCLWVYQEALDGMPPPIPKLPPSKPKIIET